MFYFTSDTHFFDDETLRTDGRPFKSAKKFDNYVIKLWNKQAKKEDTIFVVGDFVDCDGAHSQTWKTSLAYVKKIKAKVVLIIGNNEERVIKFFFDGDFEKFKAYCLELGFSEVHRNRLVTVNDVTFNLVHKPIDCSKDYLNIFGHMHRAGGVYRKYGFNVNCDMNHFYLYSEKDIATMLYDKQKYWDIDKNLCLMELK
jgi:calcineurin-like phosphoesterase family protein